MDLVKAMAPTLTRYGHDACTQIEKPKAPRSSARKAFEFVCGAVLGVWMARSLGLKKEEM